MKITFLLPVTSQPRYYKRISALQKSGVNKDILAFERDYFDGKFRYDEYILLGHIQHRLYHKRITTLLKALPKVRLSVSNSDVLYVFGFDMLILGIAATYHLHRKIKIVYEVGDIPKVLLDKSLISQGLRWLERLLLKKTSLLVVTSEAYLREYYQGIQRISQLNHQVIENKIDLSLLPLNQELTPVIFNKHKDFLCIGYFGLIRCSRSLETLRQVAEQGKGKFRIILRGKPLNVDNLYEKMKDIPYFDIGESFIDPDDLPMIYNHVDIIWNVNFSYPGPCSGTYNWARSNRFYQACFFKKPLITQMGTEDDKIVTSWDIGKSVDLLYIDKVIKEILSINQQDIIRWRQNMFKVPNFIFTYSDEHYRLMKFLKE